MGPDERASAAEQASADEQASAAEVACAESEAPTPAIAPVRVAWAVGPQTFARYARVLQPLAVGLMDELVELSIMCPPAPANQPPLGMPCEVVTCPVRGWLGYRESGIERLGENLRRWKVELIHAVDASAAELARQVALDQNLPYVVSSFDLADARRLGETASQADLLLAASQPIADALAARGRTDGRVRLLRPGVFHVRHATCFQEPGNSVAIVAGGPLENLRAFDTVLRCFAELAARKFDCVFFVIGSGRAERKLRQQALRLSLGPRITFIDALSMEQLARIFQDADIYITPAIQESIDMQSLLAMAAGVPVLAAAGEGANDFLRDGQTVMSFACGNHDELTAKLSAILDDRASARALAESALEYLRLNHSAAGNVTALARMYRQVIACRKAGSSR
jgi:glycosyltransferase involved in cell wall biosynthesis